jgi:carbamoyl-phosphate synthase/aspartate carbamoyltransferase/dihydroorotase
MSSSELLKLPGLCDPHVHLRVPGGEHKEDFHSGTAAALAGGFTTILAMPNTQPPITTVEALHQVQQRLKAEALCDVHCFAGASPDTLNQLPELSHQAVGLKIYMDQTFGPLRTTELKDLEACFQNWQSDQPIAMHAEGRSVAAGIGLAATFHKHVHFCHISRKEEIELIAAAKAQGLPVTCEVTPHHLFLSQEDLPRLGALGDMRPTLATPEDVAALWQHINTTIDCIATDHAPHTLEEKQSATPPPGVPGLETSLALMLTAVHQGRLTQKRLVELMAANPRRIYHLPTQPGTWIEVDAETEYEIDDRQLFTKCHWTPFKGIKVFGKVHRVFLRGVEVFSNGEIKSLSLKAR